MSMRIYCLVSFLVNKVFRQPEEQTHKLQRHHQAIAVTQQIKVEESRLFTSGPEGKSLDATHRAFLFNDPPDKTSVVDQLQEQTCQSQNRNVSVFHLF